MKFYIDQTTRRFVRGPASSIPLERLFLKRRDKIDVEIVFVEKSAIVATPSGTSFSTGLKTAFSDTAFLALSDSTGLLDLYTTAIEALFADDPASVSAYLEVKTSRPGEETRTSTLGVDVENSVILGDEGTPSTLPNLIATFEDVEAGTSNEKWMTPLRTVEAIAVWGGGSGGSGLASWNSLVGKPSTFPPSSHSHTAAQISDFAAAVEAVSPPAEWDALTGKPSTFPPASHTHALAEIAGLTAELATKQPAGAYAPASHGHDASQITSGQLDIARIPVLPSQVPVIVEGTLADLSTAQAAEISQGTVVLTSDGERYVYKGTGSKTSPDSYIILADITPTWSSISGKPAAFTPSAHGHGTTEVAYNTAIADSVVSVAVGGAPAAPASAWKTKTVAQVLDDILFPTLLASIGSAKSATLSVSGASGTLEVGTSVARTLTATLNRGTILNGGGAANPNPLVGAATGYTFTGTGISSTAQAGNTLAFTAAVASGANSWAVSIAHGGGSGIYTDNKGTPGTNLDASRVAGTVSASTGTITGVYPFFYLKSSSPITALSMAAAIQAGTATKVVAASTGTLSIPYAPTAQYVAVAYPAASTTKTLYFVTALDTGAITVLFAPVATQTVSTDLWSQSYKIHVSTGALTNSNATLELRN